MKMKHTSRSAILFATLMSLSLPVAAAPLAPDPLIGKSSAVDQAGYYGGRGYYGRGYGYRRRGNGIGIGLGIAGAVIGGAIIADEINRSRYRSYGYSDGGNARCSRAFRSYDPDSGTYTSYAGETLRCPYL